MDRLDFLKILALSPLSMQALKLSDLERISDSLDWSEKMPVLFLGHGSPMNAIEENEFVRGFRNAAKDIPKPKALLVVSAHWETIGSFVTAMEKPRTIHDFGGFPKALFDVQYPAPGSPQLARETQSLVKKTNVGLDLQWGLDHGTWSVVKHLYPKADVPVIQMSLDYTQPASYHYELAKELYRLRSKGVLIVGSGNMVHNLGMLAWDKLNEGPYGFDWAIEANEKMKKFILKEDHKSLIQYKSLGKSFDLAIPSPEHYLPLLYVLAQQDSRDRIQIFNDKPVAGSLTMTSVKISNS